MNSGDTAWVLAAAALVMLQTPGLAFFYGGMVRRKSVVNMLMMNFICLGVVTVLWGIVGFGLAFGPDLGGLHGSGLLGAPDWFLHQASKTGSFFGNGADKIPTLAFAMFQLMFAVLTVALISGSIAERVRFGPWTLFVALWALIVYFPIAHWVFDADTYNDAGQLIAHGGWLHNAPIHALDFAGGTTVHMNAGAAGLAMALVVGRRAKWPQHDNETQWKAHNQPMVLLGAALLWFGWYGFNAGSALTAGHEAALAFTNTTLATAMAVLGWLMFEVFVGRAPATLVGAASGAVAGLVAITPACAYVSPLGALLIGLVAGLGCAAVVGSRWKHAFNAGRTNDNGRLRSIDDSLDVVGVHLVGGFIGTMMIGFVATLSVNTTGADGLFYGGGLNQMWRQAVAAGAVLAYSFTATYALGWVVNKITPLRASDEVQLQAGGIDEAEHGDPAYDGEDATEIPAAPRLSSAS